MTLRTDVLIIGGGLAGLACASALSGAGLNVTVAEGTDRLGGRARSWTDPHTGDVVDVGPHILLSAYRNMLAFLEQLGTRGHVVWETDKFITLVDGGRPVVMHSRPLPAPLHLLPSFLGVPQLSLRDLLSNARITWLAMRLDDRGVLELDGLDARTVLERMGVSKRLIEWFWASACMAVLNVPLERCSAGALLRVYQQLIGHADSRIGMPSRGLGELFAPQAAARIEGCGGRVMLNSIALQLSHESERVTGALLENGTQIEARHCVCAIPPQELLRLVPAALRTGHRLFGAISQFRPSPYISSYIWFERKLTAERFWARTWSPDNLNYDSYDLSNLRSEWERRPSVIASNIIHSERAEALGDGEIVAATVSEIAEFLPAAARTHVVHASVHRIPMAIPAPLPGSERRRPPVRTPLPGLLLAGDWVDTGLPASMESAVRAGWLAAEAVCADRGAPRRFALAVPEPRGLVGLSRALAGSADPQCVTQ